MKRIVVFFACCALSLVVDTPARACDCGQPVEIAELVLEEVTVDGVTTPPPSGAKARFELSYRDLDRKIVKGAALVTSDGRTEWYEPIAP